MTVAATLTFRQPLTALIGVFGLIVCMTPVAFGAPGLQVVYLVPLTLTVWLMRTRTVAGPDSIVACRVWGSRQLTWSDLAGLRIDGRSRVWAVPRSGNEVRLPMVRVHDLPALAAISGGRLPDPLANPDPLADPGGQPAAPG
ncbi:MAG: PH domain-containing protein [Pseudonocardiaceae bacterium]